MTMSYRPLSSVYGKIEQVLLTYPVGIGQEVTVEKVKKKYGGIFEALGDRVDFFILGVFEGDKNKEENAFAKAMQDAKLLPERHIIHLEANYKNPKGKRSKHREWAQDPFFILEGQGHFPHLILEPFSFRFKADQFVAEQVASQSDFLIKPTHLYFEGGNILVGDDFMFVGMDDVEENIKAYYSTAVRNEALLTIKQEFQKAFGIRYVYFIGLPTEKRIKLQKTKLALGEGLQPFFHLDMFLTLGGRNKDGDEIVFLAQIDNRHLPKNFPEEDKKLLNEAIDHVHQQIVAYSEQPGPNFSLDRVPIGIELTEELTEEGKKIAHLLSFNNVLLEIYGNVKRVYLPKYDLPAQRAQLHEEAEDSFKRHDFKVISTIGEFTHKQDENAALHCIVKVLKRSKSIH